MHRKNWIFVFLHLQTHCISPQSLALFVWVEKAGGHSQGQVSKMTVNQLMPNLKPYPRYLFNIIWKVPQVCLHEFQSPQRRCTGSQEHKWVWDLQQKAAGQDSVRLRNGKSLVGGRDQRPWQQLWLPGIGTGIWQRAELPGRRKREGEKCFSCRQPWWAGSQKQWTIACVLGIGSPGGRSGQNRKKERKQQGNWKQERISLDQIYSTNVLTSRHSPCLL